jgi:hypothetical protein
MIRIRAIMWTGLAAYAAACKGQDAHIEFVYAAQPGQPAIDYLIAIVGEDKAHRPGIHPGDRFTMDFRADGGSPMVVVNYAVGEKRYAWSGPGIAAGKRYGLEVHISADNSVVSRHCIRPCELERVKLEKAQPATQIWPRRDGGAPAE